MPSSILFRSHNADSFCMLLQGSSPIVNSYDLIAIEAQSARVFQHVCEQADVDIITFDMSNRIPFQLRKPQIDTAIRRNIYFEISYSSSLGDSTGRRYFFSNATNLIRLTGGRNLIFCSAASREMLLRSPYDVTNIAILVGLSHGKALDAVSSSCAAVIARSEKRRGVKNVVVEDATIAKETEVEDIEMD